MKYSLRKSFSYRRGTDLHDDDHVNPRVENQTTTNSNSNLVKNNPSKNFLRRRRRRYSSSPPPSASPDRVKSKTSQLPYNNHINDEDEDDDPFSSSTNTNTRIRPFDRLTNQIRKSFRNTLTRRSRLESTNSNKRLITNKNDENHHSINHAQTTLPMSLTTPVISLSNTTNSSNENEKGKAPPKRRKAPLAPNHINQSVSVPNPDCSSLRISDLQESGYVSSPNDQQQDVFNKKDKLNRSFRSRISLLLKKRHAKQQQQQQQQTPNSIDEDVEQPHHDEQDENMNKKPTLSQRFDTIRRSFHLGTRNSTSKGKRHLLSNE